MSNLINVTDKFKNVGSSNPIRKIVPTFFTDVFDDFSSPSIFFKSTFNELLDNSFKVDIKESPKMFELQAQIPGLKKEDIHVSIDGGMVTIQAERKESSESKSVDERIIRSECYYGSIARSFQMPSEIDRTQTKANYENGILSLVLPKKNGGKSHEIQIN
jgi:HSP20 family protein